MPKFRLQSLAMHVVLRQFKRESVEPKLSEALTPLEGTTTQFLERKLADALQEGNDIVRADEPASPAPTVIHQFHTGELDLLEASRLLAQRLQSVQTGATSDGLLLVAEADLEGERTLVIAKLEHERGARAQPIEDMDGRQVFSIEMIDDLFMTSKSKVFKTACFGPSCADESAFRGKLTDSQIYGKSFAEYFLYEFLGCARARRAEVLTQTFFRVATKVVRELAPGDRARMYVALVTELSSNAKQVRTKDFAANHLPTDLRFDFLDHLTHERVPAVFQKDLTLIEAELRSIEVTYENGSILYSLPDEIGQSIIIAEGETTVSSRPAGVSSSRKRLSQLQRFSDVIDSGARGRG